MTNKELSLAKDKYKNLLEKNKLLQEYHKNFLEFIKKSSSIQEYLTLLEYEDVFSNRIFSLLQDKDVKKYLLIEEKYNGYKPISDNELIELAFDNTIENESNTYVYISSNKEYNLYKNLETSMNKIILKDNIKEFEKNNNIIYLKSKYHKPEEIFYNYRVMYLRQYLYGNEEILSDNKKLIKQNKVSSK